MYGKNRMCVSYSRVWKFTNLSPIFHVLISLKPSARRKKKNTPEDKTILMMDWMLKT